MADDATAAFHEPMRVRRRGDGVAVQFGEHLIVQLSEDQAYRLAAMLVEHAIPGRASVPTAPEPSHAEIMGAHFQEPEDRG